MKRKTIIAAIITAGLLFSLVGMQFVEVSRANPIVHIEVTPPPNPEIPLVKIISPNSNAIYDTKTPVEFDATIGEVNSTIGLWTVNYVCDWGPSGIPPALKAGQTVKTTLSQVFTNIPPGTHSITINVKGTVGVSLVIMTVYYYITTCSSKIDFTVQDTSPISITNLSIQNRTYASNFLPLSFVTNETTSWLSYSLDNHANNTILGNVTLIDLAEGTHSLVVYANDTFGNMGKSDIAFFNIILPTPSPSPSPSPTQQTTLEPSPTPQDSLYSDWLLYTIIALALVLAVGAIVYLRRRKGKL